MYLLSVTILNSYLKCYFIFVREINLRKVENTCRLKKDRFLDIVGEVRTHKTVVQLTTGQFFRQNGGIVGVERTIDR